MSSASDRGIGLEEFRRHRHDVLNQLQIVRALIQMNRTDRAIAALDRLAEWLQSLGRVQQVLPRTAEAMLWTLASCPHVWVDDIRVEEPPAEEATAQWASFLSELEEQCALDAKSLRLKLVLAGDTLQVELGDAHLNVEAWQIRYPRIRFSRG
ncbi:Spo0B domain-containing protein [Alicyclobacillus fructus]|uniref:Spo0B domain-containing protein n=1 Tax=Alicyclobacillus fructus TaxID=2816082 RepID=UPI001A8E3688|nr:Spo0B domain-containing protein [Alicyclobacillus fructus]